MSITGNENAKPLTIGLVFVELVVLMVVVAVVVLAVVVVEFEVVEGVGWLVTLSLRRLWDRSLHNPPGITFNDNPSSKSSIQSKQVNRQMVRVLNTISFIFVLLLLFVWLVVAVVGFVLLVEAVVG